MRQTHQFISRLRDNFELTSSPLLTAVGENPTLKAGFELVQMEGYSEESKRTLADQLQIVAANLGFDMIAAANAEGQTLAAVRLAAGEFTNLAPDDTAMLQPGLVEINGAVYSVSSHPINLASELLGTITVAQEFTLDEFTVPVVLTKDDRVVASNLDPSGLRQLETELASCTANSDCPVTLNEEYFLAVSLSGLDFGQGVELRSLQSVDSAVLPVLSVVEGLFVWSAGVALVGGLVLSWAVSRSVVRPLTDLVSPMEASVGTGLLHRVQTDSSILEINRLIDAFNGMLDSLAVARAGVRDSEERYARAVRGANDGIWDWNLQTQQCYFSPRWKSMLGYDEGEIGNTPDEWFGRILEEDRECTRQAVDKHIQRESDQLETEYRIQHRDGSFRWCLTRGLVVVDENGTPLRVAGSQTDITRRKQAEAELKAMHARLLESSRKAGMADVASSVLHNIGNVLNSVNVSADLVAESISSSKVPNLGRAVAMMQEHDQDIGKFLTEDEKGRHLPGYLVKLAQHLEREQNVNREEVRSLGKSIEHIKAIVQMQQSYARASGVLEPMHMADLVEDAIRLNEAGLRRHHVAVEREYSPLPPVMIDRHKALQIVVNLISNAKYAMDHLDVSERLVRIRISSPSEVRVQVTISDHGVGIAKDDLGKIFQHGFTNRKDGHGFGLHSSALAAQELQGSLVGESDGPGCGATFTLELPLTRTGVSA
ncbi:MAG: PAS domain-containing protein [Acidobacteria bacterium]|nr:PAS domain-containing protein [Acidobacteriota bacterium]